MNQVSAGVFHFQTLLHMCCVYGKKLISKLEIILILNPIKFKYISKIDIIVAITVIICV